VIEDTNDKGSAGPGDTDAERRVALVIGIDSHREASSLQNAVSDARAIEAVLKVIGFAERRGSSESVQGLYADVSPPPVAPELRPTTVAARDSGEGRPTKRDRRAMDRFKSRDGA